VKAFMKSIQNAAWAFPVISLCTADYMYFLKGIEYKSDEYYKTRSECHDRSAKWILKLCEKNWGLYVKAG